MSNQTTPVKEAEVRKYFNKIIDLYPNTEDNAIIALNDIRQTAFEALEQLKAGYAASTPSEQGSDGWIKGLRAILQECDEYLSAEIYEKGKPVYLNNIGANSVLHTKIKTALILTRPTPPQSK